MGTVSGRPLSRPTQKQIDAICNQIRLGLSPHIAAAATGVTPSLFDDWMRLGKNPKGPKTYVDAHDQITQVIAEMEAKAVTSVLVGMADDWKAAAWWLERTRPSRWKDGKPRKFGQGPTKVKQTISHKDEEILTPEGIQNAGQHQQHVELFKKMAMRKRLLRAVGQGDAYVPFIGDGDIAFDLYSDRKIYGADLNESRIEIAKARLPNSDIRKFDCDGWPFPEIEVGPCAVADLDAYSYPYHAYRAFMNNAKIADRCLILGTDGQRQAVSRLGKYIDPATGIGHVDLPLTKRRPLYNMWWKKAVQPYLIEDLNQRGFKIVQTQFYIRLHMLYWGIVIERTAPSKPTNPTP
jgi:hypothetical protein